MSDEWGDSTSTSTIGNGTSSGDTTGDGWAASSSGNGDTGGSWGASGGDSFGGDGNNDCWGGSSENNNSSSGGGHRGKGCFKCGEEGHMSRECPNGGSGGGGSRPQGKGCFKCGDEGHMSRECPNGGSSGGGSRPRGCFKCGEEGHMSRECPNPGSNNRGGGGRFGQRRGGEDQGSSGGGGSWDASSSSDRKASSGGGSWGPSGGEEGSEFSENSSRPQGKGCFKCGDESHQARDCSEPALDADGKPRPPIYINPDASEDTSLFEKVATGVNFDRYEGLPCAVTGVNKPKDPEKYETFEEALPSETIRAGLEATGISKPMPIQKYGMRIVMAGRDLMACAQTGSGKTLAFMLPILQDLFSDPTTSSEYGKTPQEPRAVIVSPTRELALQIYKEAYKYSRDSIVKVQIIYGGTSTGHQKAKLSEGCHVLVGTPGRILDFLDKGIFNFSSLKYFVLDEADRMIDQGFIPEIRRMASHATMPSVENRQTLMFSATFPDEVQRVAAEFLKKDYLFLAVGILGAANSDVEQTFFKVEKNEKRNKIMEVLGAKENNDRTMIFVEAKKTADFLASFLSQKGYKATSIHGDRFQHQREEALRDLKSGKYPILVATSVASRGLDIQGVLHVINYDLPKDIDDYVHRIGRTGRVGNKGRATSFYDPSFDRPLADKIVPIIEKASQSVPEWLKTEAGDNSGSAGSDDAFGGVDLRSLNVSDGATNVAKDDCWD